MSDEKLKRAFDVLIPSAGQRVRLEERVVTAWDARSRSLLDEWLDVLRARPLVNGAWVLAAMVVLMVATPLGAILGAALPRGLPTTPTTMKNESPSAVRVAIATAHGIHAGTALTASAREPGDARRACHPHLWRERRVSGVRARHLGFDRRTPVEQ